MDFNGQLKNILDNKDDIACLAVLASIEYIVCASFNGILKIWNSSGRLQVSLRAHNQRISCLTCNGNIISGSDDNSLKFWSYKGDLKETLIGHKDYVTCIAILPSPEGDRIVSGSRDRFLKVWSSKGDLKSNFNWTSRLDCMCDYFTP